jgi:hypothetical protein
LSSHLPHCHECQKFANGSGNEYAVCQFEGFRKIKKKTAHSTHDSLVTFVPAGFLDADQVRIGSNFRF